MSGLTIPANQLVNIIPGVLAAGGNGLQLLGVCLTTSTRVPIAPLGFTLSFPNATAVGAFFGLGEGFLDDGALVADDCVEQLLRVLEVGVEGALGASQPRRDHRHGRGAVAHLEEDLARGLKDSLTALVADALCEALVHKSYRIV